MMCWLNKSLCRPKQVPRAWFSRFKASSRDLGSIDLKSDASLFTRFIDGEVFYILVYVDDLVITGSSNSQIDTLIL